MGRKAFISTLLIGAALGLAQLSQAQISTQLSAQDYLGAEWMQSQWHTVSPNALNDGVFNRYEITTPDGTYTVRGTSQARQNIREIYAIYQLRERSVVDTFADSVTTRTVNWVKTPLRTIGFIGNRIGTIDSVGDAALFVPKAVYDTGDVVVSSVGEFAVTGKRVAAGAAGTKCEGFGRCVGEAGEDIWSGINSLLGKHKVSRRLHEEFGTDRQTNNPLLKREIDRLSYTEAYTGSAFKFAVPNANIDVISDYQTGIGYFNNAEFVAGYTDAHRPRNAQKKMLAEAGVSQEAIDTLYRHELYTHNQRTVLAEALETVQTKGELSGFVEGANNVQNPESADSTIALYRYLASKIQQGQIERFAAEPVIIAQNADGSLFTPVRADYLQWSNGLEAQARALSAKSRAINTRAQLHLLGRAAPDVSRRLNAMGITLVQAGLY